MKAIFITARLKSTRLPRKILLEVNNKPIIQYLIDRLLHNQSDAKIIICTSTNSQDDDLVRIAQNNDIEIFRGSEEDVIDRYYQCAQKYSIQLFYVIYADEPFIDIELMNKTFEQLIDSKVKLFVDNSNLIDGTYGYGFNFDAIKFINERKTSNCNEVWGNMVSKMNIDIIKNQYKSFPYQAKDIRLTIDYEEDFNVFNLLIKHIDKKYIEVELSEICNAYLTLNLKSINGFRSMDYINRLNEQGKQ